MHLGQTALDPIVATSEGRSLSMPGRCSRFVSKSGELVWFSGACHPLSSVEPWDHPPGMLAPVMQIEYLF